MGSGPFLNANFNACAMPTTAPQDGEQKTGFYKLFIAIDGTRQVVDVHEIAMDGWRLFECYLYGADVLVFLSQEDGEATISCIDMGDAADARYGTILIEALSHFIQRGN